MDLQERIFNLYDLMIVMIIIQSFIFTALLLVRSDQGERGASHYFLPAFISSIGIGQLCFLLTYNPVVTEWFRDVFSVPLLLLLPIVFYVQGPLLLAYVRSLTSSGSYHFSVVDGLPVIVFVTLYGGQIFETFESVLAPVFWQEYIFLGVTGFLVTFVYGVFCLIHMGRYEDRLKARFSTIEKLDYLWLRAYCVGFLVVWFLELVPPFVQELPDSLKELLTHAALLLEIIMVNFVVFSCLIHSRKVITLEPESERDSGKGDQEALNQEKSNELSPVMEQLETLMSVDRLYLQSGLTIDTVAKELEIPTKQLSFIINRYYEKNFYEFVNYYRVEESKRLLKDPGWRDEPIITIYTSVGFKSKSSFFTLFKRYVGMTPCQYRAKYGEVQASHEHAY